MLSKCIRTTNPRHLLVARRTATPRPIRAASTSVSSSQIRVNEHHAYCKDFIQKHDYEAYLVSHLYPADKRKGYFAIKAFYVCTASRVDDVSDSQTG
jgi:NADH dehydrogenase [ubiquinone] 1 alpha subcomplex assembly factor 6